MQGCLQKAEARKKDDAYSISLQQTLFREILAYPV